MLSHAVQSLSKANGGARVVGSLLRHSGGGLVLGQDTPVKNVPEHLRNEFQHVVVAPGGKKRETASKYIKLTQMSTPKHPLRYNTNYYVDPAEAAMGIQGKDDPAGVDEDGATATTDDPYSGSPQTVATGEKGGGGGEGNKEGGAPAGFDEERGEEEHGKGYSGGD